MTPRQRAQVGIVGAGQLARMTVQAAIGIDVGVRVLAGQASDSAALVSREAVVGSVRSLSVLQAFAADCDVVTFDHELVQPAHLQRLEADGHQLRPAPQAKRFAQDKLHQRRALAAAGVPVPEYAAVETLDDISVFAERHGWPVVCKGIRGGYDGRGVWTCGDRGRAERVVAEAQTAGVELLVERHVPIDSELAVLVARRQDGQARTYPLVETIQTAGILTELAVPAPLQPALAAQAIELGAVVADTIGVVGMLAVELFRVGDELLVNELAARPHNSGHWSIEGATTSQFENHLRAVLDWPLGETTMTAPAAATVNLLGPGDGSDPRSRMATTAPGTGVRVHLYGKQARPGRKLGHVTALGADIEQARERARHAAALLSGVEEVSR